MCKCCITGKTFKIDLDLNPQADLINCAIKAVAASIPCFLQAFMACITQSETPDEFTPGDRKRCD